MYAALLSEHVDETPLVSGIADALVRPNDDACTVLACFWIADKVEAGLSYRASDLAEIMFEFTCLDGADAPRRGTRRDLLLAEHRVWERVGYVLPRRTKVHEIWEGLDGERFDGWLHAILASKTLHLLSVEEWVATLRMAEAGTFTSVVQLWEHMISERLAATLHLGRRKIDHVGSKKRPIDLDGRDEAWTAATLKRRQRHGGVKMAEVVCLL